MSDIGRRADRPLDVDAIEQIALSVRRQLWRDVGLLEAVPIARLMAPARILGPRGWVTIGARLVPILPRSRWLCTWTEDATTWVGCHPVSWDELAAEATRTRFGIAHEIGHIVLHPERLYDAQHGLAPADEDDDLDPAWDMEVQANRFAAHLLCPDAALREADHRGLALDVDAVAERWGLGRSAARLRLDEARGAPARPGHKSFPMGANCS